MESSILKVLNLFDLGVENIIIKARDGRCKRILFAFGLEEDKVIIPDVIIDKMIATKSLFDIKSEVLQSIDNEYLFTSITLKEEKVIDKSIFDAGLSFNKDFNIIQIKRNDKTLPPR